MQKNKKGSALITALFIMTLVAIAATAMSVRLRLDIYRTNMALLSDKIYLAGQTVMFWAISELHKKKSYNTSTPEGQILAFPPNLRGIYPGMDVSGGLYDLQARFNLNNINGKYYFPVLNKLMTNIFPKLPSPLITKIALAAKDWISPYQPGKITAFTQYYLSQKPPYYPSHQPFVSVSELRLVYEVSDQMYQALMPYIIALPEATPININTASKQVLKALGNGLSDSQLNELLAARGKEGISDLKKVSTVLEKLNLRSELFTIKSQYFLSVSTVKAEDLTIMSYAILKRTEDKDKKITVNVIQDSMNTL